MLWSSSTSSNTLKSMTTPTARQPFSTTTSPIVTPPEIAPAKVKTEVAVPRNRFQQPQQQQSLPKSGVLDNAHRVRSGTVDDPADKGRYSSDQLMLLKNVASTRKKPANLLNSFNNVRTRSDHSGGGGGGGDVGKRNLFELLLTMFIKDRVGGGAKDGGEGGGVNTSLMIQQDLPKRPPRR